VSSSSQSHCFPASGGGENTGDELRAFELTEDQIAMFVKQGAITGEMAEQRSRKSRQRRRGFREAGSRDGETQKDIDRIVRLRDGCAAEHEAIRGSAEEKLCYNAYTRQFGRAGDSTSNTAEKKINDTHGQPPPPRHACATLPPVTVLCVPPPCLAVPPGPFPR